MKIFYDCLLIMSLSSKEERPKLKAKRFNKFESSSQKLGPENENITKQGTKRSTNGNNNISLEAKRICTNTNLNIQPVKNLANNRLKRLKEQIQASVQPNDLNPPNNVITKPTLNRNHSRNTDSAFAKASRSFSDSDVKNGFKNISPIDTSKKNLAEERLRNIKSKLHKVDIPCGASNRTIKNNNLKRNISNVINAYDSDGGSNKKLSKKSVSSSKFENTPKSICAEQNSSNLTKRKVENLFLEKCNTSVVVPSSPVSETVNKNNNNLREKICQPSQKPHVMVNEASTSNLPATHCSNFLSKMEMTASWIRNHQVHTNIGFIEPLGDSLNERTEETHNTKCNDESEEMEWTNAEPDDTVIDPNRNTIDTCKEDKEIIKDPEKIKDICVVVDTNVFISGLSKVQDIINLKGTGSSKPIIFVPWMVITELDYMKDSCSNGKLLKNIVSAIKFINASLKEKNPQVVGQTVFDVEKQKYIGASADDKIISCCLQAAEKYETVILLSNDMNLKNKAMINDITACSSNEVIMKLMRKLVKNTKMQKIIHKMGIMCSSVICDCMKSAYGDIWWKMDMMNRPPWSLGECLRRFKKYWTSVFSEKLMKQFTKTVQNLQEIIERNSRHILDDSDDFVEFMKLCVALCIFLKDIEECRGVVENTLAEITKAAQ